LDLTPPDSFLFLQLKSVLKGQHFAITKDVAAKVTRALTEVLKNGFQESFQMLYKYWQKLSLHDGTTLKEML
jgi:hypothetical protein